MIDSVPALISILGILLAYLHAQRHSKDAKVDDALDAIQEALSETTKYLQRENAQERERTRELDLSNLWKIASIRVRKINPDLAKRLRFKSSYWENSINLSRKEVLESGIALKQIKKEFDQLYSNN